MPTNNQTNATLPAGESPALIKGADDLALEALASSTDDTAQEVKNSDQFAQTLQALEGVIEAKAKKLMDLKDKLKEKKEMVRNVFENDADYQEAIQAKDEASQVYKQRQSSLNDTTQVRELNEDVRMINEDIKDLEESLSNHLINYHQLTNSTSFDTSDGDQWEFQIKAKVKSKHAKAE